MHLVTIIEIKKSEKFRIERKLVISSIRLDYSQREREETFNKRKKEKNPPLLISNISSVSLSTGINFPTLINVIRSH